MAIEFYPTYSTGYGYRVLPGRVRVLLLPFNVLGVVVALRTVILLELAWIEPKC